MYDPRRLHPAGILLIAIRTGRHISLPVLAGGLSWILHREIDLKHIVMGLVALILLLTLLTVWGILSWRKFTYQLENEGLRIEHGVIARKRRFIPKERIQAIDLSEGILHRILRIVSVRIETAGGNEPEASLLAVTREDALRLRSELTINSTANTTEQTIDSSTTPPPLQKWLSSGDLLIAAATSGRLGIVLGLLGGAYQFVDNFVPENLINKLENTVLASSLTILFFIALIMGLAAWMLAAIGTIVAYGGFRLTREGDFLFIERGLLERRRATIPIARIQAIRIVENVLRQPFGFATIHVESAAYGKKSGESIVLIPIIRRTQVYDFLREITPAFAVQTEIRPLTKTALPGYILRSLLPVSIIILPVSAMLSIWFFPQALWCLLALPPAALYGYLKFLDAGWSIVDDTLFIRARKVSRETAIIPKRRIQYSRITTSPFQRRKRLATFQARVASGSLGKTFHIRSLRDSDVDRLLDWWERNK